MINEFDIIKFCREEMKKPFEWGVTDCNTIGARFLDLIISKRGVPTEYCYADQITGQYSSMIEAVKFQKEFGRSAEKILIDERGEYITPGFEHTGDFIIVDAEHWQMCHIYVSGKVLSACEELGVTMSPIRMMPEPYKVIRVR